MIRNSYSSRLGATIAGIAGLALAASVHAAPRHGTTDGQNFDSANNAWVGFNNDPIAGTGGAGGHIRFYNTNNTLGGPAGEAGGTLSRTDGQVAYYADTTIGGPTNLTLNVGDRMFASGEFFVDRGVSGASTANTGDTILIVGYFNRSQTPASLIANADNWIGFRINSVNGFRANLFGGDYGGYNGSGGNAGAAIEATIADNSAGVNAYTWNFVVTPGGFTVGGGQFQYSEMVLTLTPTGGGAPITLRNALNPAQNRLTRTLDTFGILAFNADDMNSTLTNTYFVDSFSYFVIPEPSAIGVLMGAVACGGMLRWRRKRT
jgi:hypothetical protein